MADEQQTIGILTRASRWLFGSKTEDALSDAEMGVQRLSVITVWVPMALCALATVTLLVEPTSNLPPTSAFVRLVSLGTAALAVGCFFGLLFGTPRVNDGAPVPDDAAKKDASTQVSPLAANNNFYKIADWVTSAIVGIALVELKSFADWFWKALKLVIGANDTLQIAIAAGVIVALFFAGFIWTFLNARVILMKAFASADRSAHETMQLRERVDQLRRQAGDVAAEFQRLWESDPNKNAFGGEPSRNGRTLSVTKVTEPTGSRVLDVEIAVSADSGAAPLTSPVTFFMHPTHEPQRQTVKPANGVARLKIGVAEAYTIGATCDDGATQLELDLETVDAIPARYKTESGPGTPGAEKRTTSPAVVNSD